MNIVYAIDKNVYKLALVSVSSLLENNKNEKITIYLLYQKISPFIFKKFESLQKIRAFNLKKIKVDISHFKGLPFLPLTVETWFRLELAELLPNEDRTLYLDCDTMICSSLSEIYNRPMDDNDVMVRYENNLFAKEYLTLKSKTYFNAGVMLCNLKAWREHNLSKKLFEIAYRYKGKLKYNDQDVFNIVCDSSKILFNPGDVFLTYHPDNAENHTIVHFIGPKPNTIECVNKKYQQEWWNYARKTPCYKSLKHEYFMSMLKLFLNRLYSISKIENKTIIRILGIKICIKRK